MITKKQFALTITLFLLAISLSNCGGNKQQITWTGGEAQPENTTKPILNVYIENSGSMDGYMCDSSELKDAVYSYVSALDTYADTTRLFFINSMIIPRNVSIKKFIYDLTPSVFKNAGGSRGNSDIADMFEQMLARSNDKTISIFVSDCILDVPDGNATNFFNLKETQICNALRKYYNNHPKFGVEVLRLESLFNGTFYYYHSNETLSKVHRPYFMIIMGNKDLLALVNKKFPPSKEIKHGIKNSAAFTSQCEIPYTISNSLGFTGKKKDKNQVIVSGNEFLITADYSQTLQPNEVLSDISNFKSSYKPISVKSITEYQADDHFTHVLSMSVNGDIQPTSVILQFIQPTMPTWVAEYNDDNGRDIKKNIEKTSGIKYIIQGIANTFKNEKPSDVNFVINNK